MTNERRATANKVLPQWGVSASMKLLCLNERQCFY